MYDIFRERYRKYKDQLIKKNIFTLDQLTSSDGTRLLQWKQIPSKNAVSLKGKIPNWFRELEDNVTNSKDTRILKREYKITNNIYKSRNTRIILSTKLDYRKNNWIAGIKTSLTDRIVMGILITKKPEVYISADIELIHYKLTDNNTNSVNSLEVKKCGGCSLGIINNNNCVIKVVRKYSILIKSRVINKKEGNETINIIEQMISDLEMEISRIKDDGKIPTNIVNIQVGQETERYELIENLVGKYNVNRIFKLYMENYQKSKNKYIFFTDGSLKQQASKVDMGLGWVLIENDTEIQYYNGKLEGGIHLQERKSWLY